MPSTAWSEHLSQYRSSHPAMSFKECMIHASKTYRGKEKPTGSGTVIKHFRMMPDGSGSPFDVSAEVKVKFTSDGGTETIGALYNLVVGAGEGLASRTFTVSGGASSSNVTIYQFVKKGKEVRQTSLDGSRVRIVVPKPEPTSKPVKKPAKGISVGALKNIPMVKNLTGVQFVYMDKSKIEAKGGKILALDISKNFKNDRDVAGIVLDAENVLHICPGGGYESFEVKDFAKLMPEAAKNLDKAPIAWTIDGRHPGKTLSNFKQWQKS